MKKFEYKKFSDVNIDHSEVMVKLGQFGESGWELVSVVDQRESYGLI